MSQKKKPEDMKDIKGALTTKALMQLAGIVTDLGKEAISLRKDAIASSELMGKFMKHQSKFNKSVIDFMKVMSQ